MSSIAQFRRVLKGQVQSGAAAFTDYWTDCEIERACCDCGHRSGQRDAADRKGRPTDMTGLSHRAGPRLYPAGISPSAPRWRRRG
jgi:hypothetical protein